MAQRLGYSVRVITTHHDKNRCFEETKPHGELLSNFGHIHCNSDYAGVLGSSIAVFGDWIPRHIAGKCTALCAILRMMYASIALVLTRRSADEIILTDGVSFPVPLLQVESPPCCFYSHVWFLTYLFYCICLAIWISGCILLSLSRQGYAHFTLDFCYLLNIQNNAALGARKKQQRGQTVVPWRLRLVWRDIYGGI
jgi:hypothetical protein